MDVKGKNSNRGLFYTVALILLILPLILLISFYVSVSHAGTEQEIEEVRCDELHYFIEDIREDLKRAMLIFGRRAVIYAIDDVVESGQTLQGYRFNCTSNCFFDCSGFQRPDEGAPAAITELAVCGTLNGQNVSYMVNHTLSQWLDRIISQGDDMNFNITIDLHRVDTVPSDPWNFAIITNATYNVQDKEATCFYVGDELETISYTPILGLEDPLYPLNTNSYVIKYIDNCTIDIDTNTVAGCSIQDSGNHTATGNVIFLSDIPVGDRGTYCQDHQMTVNDEILVVDTAFGTAPCSAGNFDRECFNSSSPYHFAGAINYDKNREQPFVENCDLTIPWIAATGDMDDLGNQNPGWDRPAGCDMANFSTYECVAIHNDEDCNDHQVLIGKSWDNYNTSCYMQSTASLYGGEDGPSFFDRLEGGKRLSEKYSNMSSFYFNTSMIGIETMINPLNLEHHGVNPDRNLTWVDYLYWDDVEGCDVDTVCKNSSYKMKLDDVHAKVYRVNTDCESGKGCYSGAEVCVDGVDQDNQSDQDWLDGDCAGYFVDCGTMLECDPGDVDHCGTCDAQPPEAWSVGEEKYCGYYGLNTTEWHFYQVSPGMTGRMNVTFNGSSAVLGEDRTDIMVYNYSIDGDACVNRHVVFNLEDVSSADFCVEETETYVIGFDVDAPDPSYLGSYTITSSVKADVSCGSPTTTSSTTTSTSTSTTASTSTSTTTTTTVPCGFFDDMESGEGLWAYGEDYGTGEWEVGIPNWGSSYSGTDCWATDLSSADADGDHYYEHWTSQWLRSKRINLSSASGAQLIFRHKYWIRDGSWHTDTAYVEASDDDASYSTLGTFSDREQNWVEQTYDLSGYDGGDVYIRFRLESDWARRNRGWYIDDFNVTC